jgi:hypothetical protein
MVKGSTAYFEIVPVTHTKTKRIVDKISFVKRFYLPLIIIQLTLYLSASAQQDKKPDKIKPGKRQAVLILSDGTTIQLTENDSLDYTSQINVSVQKDSIQPKVETIRPHQTVNTRKRKPESEKKDPES